MDSNVYIIKLGIIINKAIATDPISRAILENMKLPFSLGKKVYFSLIIIEIPTASATANLDRQNILDII